MRRGRKSISFRRKREPRTNERIKAPQLRVITEGHSPALMSREKALELAKSLNLDLVEVSAAQDPPVCRIIDYGKYRFEQKKRKRQQARHQHTVTIKEIKIRPKIAVHDYDLKKRNALSFLKNGDKVKVTVRFRGREITHPELGMQLMERLMEDLKTVSVVEAAARQDGRQINMVIAPRPGLRQSEAERKKAKPTDQAAASQAATGQAATNQATAGQTVTSQAAADQAAAGQTVAGRLNISDAASRPAKSDSAANLNSSGSTGNLNSPDTTGKLNDSDTTDDLNSAKV